MNDSDILMPKTVEFALGDRKYEIGKLKMTQRILLVRAIAETIFKSRENLEKLQRMTQESATIAEDLLVIFGLLSPDSLLGVFSIVLGEQDKEFLDSEFDENKISEFVACVCETNDFNFDEIKKNIARIKERFKKKAI